MECRRILVLLESYADKSLSAHDAENVRRHLNACGDCRNELTSIRRLTALMHKAKRGIHIPRLIIPVQTMLTGVYDRVFIPLAAAAAVVFITVGVALLVSLPYDDDTLFAEAAQADTMISFEGGVR